MLFDIPISVRCELLSFRECQSNTSYTTQGERRGEGGETDMKRGRERERGGGGRGRARWREGGREAGRQGGRDGGERGLWL